MSEGISLRKIYFPFASKDRAASCPPKAAPATGGPHYDRDRAMWLAVGLETLARQYFNTLLIGGPVLLDGAEIAGAAKSFANYGPRDTGRRIAAADRARNPAPGKPERGD